MTVEASSAMADAEVLNSAEGFDPSYRSVSPLALVALLLGILSPSAFAAPLLLAVPVVALLVASVALRQIAASDGALVGRAPALLGLALAVASLSGVLTRDAVHRYLIHAQAEGAAEQWLETIKEGRLEDAYVLTVPQRQRSIARGQLVDVHSEHGEKFDVFRNLGDLRPLLAPGGVEGFRYRGGSYPQRASQGRLVVTLLYDLLVKGADEPIRYQLVLERAAAAAPEATPWRVVQVTRVTPET